ncbi:MAG: hypothetical protein H0Z19_01155 [Archaeoglobus sp.]|uniref:DUF5658 family protein n=1 Tax=Archaeoglobus sp. TaxID=1872626 RepID=UPI001D899C4B|nr:DUF5658 family protein [Archaeoglobus sp.]MBO8179082.1 hypothetical protein [Archaeoglobus sp.]
MKKIKLLLTTFAIVNLTDYLTTVKGIEMGFRELNEFVASLTPASFLLLKVAILATIFALVLSTRKLNFPLNKGVHLGIVVGLTASTAVLGVCSFHNLLLLLGFKEIEVIVKLMSGVLALV